MSNVEKKVVESMRKAGGPVRPGDIAKTSGLDSKEVSGVIKELKSKGVVISPKRCFYSLAE